MINFNFDKHCCGCGACVDACKKQCISIIENQHGFRIPFIDKKKCVSCGTCSKVCPILNVNKRENKEQKCYCTYHLDEKIRNAGSSGSMFYLLADWVIKNNGVVFGAAFDENLQLRHTIAKNSDDLYPLMKSKYLQSDTTGVFKKVRVNLSQNKIVLFVGTPCQCQALYNYTYEEEKGRLYLVDFICHGVPSQNLFNRYIKSYEKRKNVKVKTFSFRQKALQSSVNEEDVRHYKIEAIDKKGNQIIDTGFYDKCSFYVGFKSYQIFRNSCYKCKFVGRNRITDYTLGDFWHLTEYEPEISDFNKGYSEFIVNSERGNKLFKNLKHSIYYKEYSMDIPMNRNYAYTKPTIKHIDRDIFIELYNVLPYSILKYLWSNNLIFRILRKALRKIAR